MGTASLACLGLLSAPEIRAAELWTAGSNQWGQMGTPQISHSIIPRTVTVGSSSPRKVVAKANDLLYLDADDTLWGAGQNYYGQLGTGDRQPTSSPVEIASDVVAFDSSGRHIAFVTSAGELWAIGNGGLGRLGQGVPGFENGGDQSSLLPVQIPSPDLVKGVDLGPSSTFFITAKDDLWVTGTVGATTRYSPEKIAEGVSEAAVGLDFYLYTTTDQKLWGVGSNADGQLGTGNSQDVTTPVLMAEGVTQVDAGTSFSVFRKSDNTLWICGGEQTFQSMEWSRDNALVPYQIDSAVTDFAISDDTILWIKEDGTV
jgi:alpha-tubulin suppressor-like RCC1 family protein